MRTEDGYIIYRCLNGDSTAFGFLVDKYKAGVYAFAYERLHNFHDAEDVAQEVFLKAYRSLRTLRRWDSFASWLYRITLNLCRGRFRSQSSRPDHEFIEDQEPELVENHSRDLYLQELACESVREAVDSLPEMYSQVLTLHYLGGMTSMEIARFVGVSSAAVRKRLSKARSLLKEEMITMMSTTLKEQRLQASFTLRIVNAVKRMRIQPTPRTGGLPWGLSLATGIIFAVLNLIPQPGILNSVATGSPLPGESRVLKTGEIPVDILAVSEVPIIANRQGDDGREPGTAKSRIVTSASAQDEGNIWMQNPTSDKDSIIDAKTGVEYIKVKSLKGKSDIVYRNVIQYYTGLNLSSNGRFLLWEKTVIPLDNSDPFDLMDMSARRGTLSPNGEKVAFYSSGAIWIIPVSPETGRPTGSATKLAEGEYRLDPYSWSPDSQRLAVVKSSDIWTVSVVDGKITQITDHPLHEMAPVWSPDGKTIAYSRGTSSIWLIPSDGGTSRNLVDNRGRISTVVWSPDGQWLACNKLIIADSKLWLIRIADGHEIKIEPPQKAGMFLSWSPDGKKMLFYRASYDPKSTLRVAPVSGGPSFELGSQLDIEPYWNYWSSDSRMIVSAGLTQDRDWMFWIIPVNGDDPFPLKLDVSVPEGPGIRSLSPDGGMLLLSVKQSETLEDLWVVPISLKDGRTTGKPVMVFNGRDVKPEDGIAWSPDGRKLAMIHGLDIWIVPVEGGEPIQITETSEAEHYPVWSPDGKMIAYEAYYSARKATLHVIPASGGEARKLLDTIGQYRWQYAWSPDSKELAVISEEGLLLAIPIAGGEARTIADLNVLSTDHNYDQGVHWSPDGQQLVFRGYREDKDDPGHIFIVSAEGGEITEAASDDHGIKSSPLWSPDGKWISYASDANVKTRPEAEIWEADVSELLSIQEKE